MRTVIALVALVIVAVALAAFSSRLHPSGGPSLREVEDAKAEVIVAAARKQAQASVPSAPKLTGPARLAAFHKFEAGAIRATLTIENRGTMVLELYPKAAPKTVAHFVKLCKAHFYDGIKFHRLDPGFIVQAGDPLSRQFLPNDFPQHGVGLNGSGTTVPLEVNLPHTAFSIGLARTDEPNSGDSQFYINLKDNPELDGNYCVFGRVIQGSEIAPKIQLGDRITSLTIP